MHHKIMSYSKSVRKTKKLYSLSVQFFPWTNGSIQCSESMYLWVTVSHGLVKAGLFMLVKWKAMDSSVHTVGVLHTDFLQMQSYISVLKTFYVPLLKGLNQSSSSFQSPPIGDWKEQNKLKQMVVFRDESSGLLKPLSQAHNKLSVELDNHIPYLVEECWTTRLELWCCFCSCR